MSSAADAKVARIGVQDLIRSSEQIMIAQVEGLQSIDGLIVARAIPQRVLKGPVAPAPIYFVASPTWACDVSAAMRGETAVLFLNRAPSEKVRRKSSGALTVHVTVKLLYLLAHSGRGRWPITVKDGQNLAAVHGDIELAGQSGRMDRDVPRKQAYYPLADLEKLLSDGS